MMILFAVHRLDKAFTSEETLDWCSHLLVHCGEHVSLEHSKER